MALLHRSCAAINTPATLRPTDGLPHLPPDPLYLPPPPGGKDHIFTLTHDEGACWAPNEIINSTILTHWGRMDNNTSETGFGPDDFSFDYKTEGPPLPDGWVKHIRWHTCYDPRRVGDRADGPAGVRCACAA